jgi:hypothetical protein
VHVASQEIEQLCMCVLGGLRLSMIYLMDFGTVPTVWYFLVFNLTILQNIYGSVWFRFMVFNAASSTTKIGRHDILVTEILLKVALNTKN